MSLGRFNEMVREGYEDVFGSAAMSFASRPDSSLIDTGPGEGLDDIASAPQSLMDSILNAFVADSDPAQDNNGPVAQEGLNLAQAWNAARDGGPLANIQTGQAPVTAAEGNMQQANAAIEVKGKAVDHFRAAIKDVEQDAAPQAEAEGPAAGAGGPIGNFVRDTAIGAVAGVAADIVVPGSSAIVGIAGLAVAAYGAGTNGAQGSSTIPSLDSDEGYHAGGGMTYTSVTEMSAAPAAKPATSGLIANYETNVQPWLCTEMKFGDETLGKMKDDCDALHSNVESARNDFASLMDSDIDMRDGAGDVPYEALELDEAQQIALTIGDPVAQAEALRMAMPKVNAGQRFGFG